MKLIFSSKEVIGIIRCTRHFIESAVMVYLIASQRCLSDLVSIYNFPCCESQPVTLWRHRDKHGL